MVGCSVLLVENCLLFVVCRLLIVGVYSVLWVMG